MKTTISVHNGTQVSREHNRRNPKVVSKEEHIHEGRWYEVWHDESAQDAYKRIFQKAVDDYNYHQQRADRKIRNYLKQVKESKTQHVAYETIFTVGNVEEHPDPQTCHDILKQLYEDWKKMNPNLEIIGAYFHGDEEDRDTGKPSTPHLHIDYVPVAHNYTRGPKTQTGLVKALGEMGYQIKGRETAQIQWERAMRAHLKELAQERGIEVKEPTAEKREHLNTRDYKLTKRVQKAEARVREAEKRAASLEEANTQLSIDLNAKKAVEAKYEALRAYIEEHDFYGGEKFLEEFDRSQRIPKGRDFEIEL
jgi:hypothetical protein